MRTQTRGSATPAAPTQTAIAGLAAVGLAAVICCAGALPASAAGPSGPPRPVPAPTPPPNSRAILAWGSNAYGELGIGTTTDSDVPAIVQAPGATQYTVVRGMLSSYAVTAGGKLYAWGLNSVGQLGDGTKTMRLKPVQVKLPAGVKVTAVRAGGSFALALTSTGRVLSWGANNAGQLGTGSTRPHLRPVWVNLPRGVKATSIAASSERGYAVTSTGRLLGWGYNQEGTLGDGTTKERKAPVYARLPAGTKVRSVAAGLQHTLVLTSTGRVLGWGDDSLGQLGNGTFTSSMKAVRAKLPAGVKVTALVAGKYFSMALTSKHNIMTWGSNDSGELGNGTTAGSSTPVNVSLPPFTAYAIGAGWGSSTALTTGKFQPL